MGSVVVIAVAVVHVSSHPKAPMTRVNNLPRERVAMTMPTMFLCLVLSYLKLLSIYKDQFDNHEEAPVVVWRLHNKVHQMLKPPVIAF